MGRDSCDFALAPWWSLRNCGLLTYMMSILGIDVLQANGCQVDLALIIGGKEVPLWKSTASPRHIAE